jgi:DNA repair photolyase
MAHNFRQGQHGCPVNCAYCVVTEVDRRRAQWNDRTILGVNKAVTILNPPPERTPETLRGFYDFPVELLRGDIVGFEGISDPFWPKYAQELEWFLEHVSPVAKLVTCVTKWNVSDSVLDRLAEIPNFRLVVSITGLDILEKTTTAQRLSLLARAKERGVKTFPIIHPYIPEMSDLSFLLELKKLGYDEIDIKGLRYSESMNSWMPDGVQKYFAGSGGDEVLVDDGWVAKLDEAGLKKISLKSWYRLGFEALSPHCSSDEAEDLVARILERANITSSDTDEAVVKAAIERRL